MSDTTPAQAANPEPQAANPEPQAGDGQQQEQEQAKTETLTPEQLRAKLTEVNSEAAATRKKLREAEAKLSAAEKAKEDAAKAQAAEQGRYQELYEAEQKARAAAEERVRQMEFDQQRRDAAQAAGIPQLWQRLQGSTPEELAEDAKTLATFVQPASGSQPGRTATTQPTPAPQSAGGLTVEERRARATRTI